MRGKNIILETNDYSCDCSLFPQTKLTLSVSKPLLQTQSHHPTNNTNYTFRETSKRDQKISISQLKKERDKSKGYLDSKHNQQQESLNPNRQFKQNLEKVTHTTSHQIPIQRTTRDPIFQNTYQKQQTKRQVSATNKYIQNHHISIQKQQPKISSRAQVRLQQQIQHQIMFQQPQTKFHVIQIPTKYQTNVIHKSITPTKRLNTDRSQPTTITSIKTPILSTQGSNCQIPHKMQVTKDQPDGSANDSSISSNLSCVLKQKYGVRFRAIESVKCPSQQEDFSQVISCNGFLKSQPSYGKAEIQHQGQKLQKDSFDVDFYPMKNGNPSTSTKF